MFGLIFALVVVAAAATIAVRSATAPVEDARPAIDPTLEPPKEAAEEAPTFHPYAGDPDATQSFEPFAIDPDATQAFDAFATNGGATAPAFDPEATQTAPPIEALVFPVPQEPSTQPASALAETIVMGPPVIVEDLHLAEVLDVAQDPAPDAHRPALKLIVGITVLSIVFAGALLVIVRGLGSLLGNFFK